MYQMLLAVTLPLLRQGLIFYYLDAFMKGTATAS